jgi:sodium transport system ATP-binding protein
MIEIENLTKMFGKFTALDKINMSINKGEIYGLLGENGAGKTTMLRLLSTIMQPTSGTITVLGDDIVKQSDKVRGNIGILFGGETGLYDRLTARENIEFFAKLNDMKKDKINERIEKLVKIFDMEEYIDKRVGGFSKGMKQKVSFARAVVHNPEIIMLDEPTSGLDVTAITEVHKFIKDCKNEGKTVVFSSHTMSEVEKLCDKVAIIHKGKIMDIGTQNELKDKYKLANIEEVFRKLIGDDNEF